MDAEWNNRNQSYSIRQGHLIKLLYNHNQDRDSGGHIRMTLFFSHPHTHAGIRGTKMSNTLVAFEKKIFFLILNEPQYKSEKRSEISPYGLSL